MPKLFCYLFILFPLISLAQDAAVLTPAVAPTVTNTKNTDLGDERPNGKRIRRQVNLIVGLDHDEELRIPNIELKYGGRTEFIDIKRIQGTDYFRFVGKKAGSGIITLSNKKTGQILVELRFDIRDDSIEKTLREVQAMLGDIEGIEFKIINNTIYIDGYTLLPKDLVRIAQVLTIWKEGGSPIQVRSLARLSPLSRKKIVEFISNDVNNPEVKITSIGDFIKLEGQVNNEGERKRIIDLVSLYMPDIVTDQAPDTTHIKISGRKATGDVKDIIIDLLTIKPDDEKVEPPPKMIQIVAHFVKFGDNYTKNFSFTFSPFFSAQSAVPGAVDSTINSTINLLNNLLPKLQWGKTHGYLKVLDTASILVQDKLKGSITRTVTTFGAPLPPSTPGGQTQPNPINATVALNVSPSIKSERSGLIELKDLDVNVSTAGGNVEPQTTTSVKTTISVRDRQSAAFGGTIKKSSETSYGAPANSDAIVTFNAKKNYDRNGSQFVVFVTPIIKSSASSGVEQVKKKFRLRD